METPDRVMVAVLAKAARAFGWSSTGEIGDFHKPRDSTLATKQTPDGQSRLLYSTTVSWRENTARHRNPCHIKVV
jgi:hypothetical protein